MLNDHIEYGLSVLVKAGYRPIHEHKQRWARLVPEWVTVSVFAKHTPLDLQKRFVGIPLRHKGNTVSICSTKTSLNLMQLNCQHVTGNAYPYVTLDLYQIGQFGEQ